MKPGDRVQVCSGYGKGTLLTGPVIIREEDHPGLVGEWVQVALDNSVPVKNHLHKAHIGLFHPSEVVVIS